MFVWHLSVSLNKNSLQWGVFIIPFRVNEEIRMYVNCSYLMVGAYWCAIECRNTIPLVEIKN